MWLQLLLILIAFILYILNAKNDNKITRHRYVNFLIILLVIQSGLRHLAVGADTYAYFRSFEDVQKSPWSYVFNKFYDVYVLHEGKDAGYDFLVKVFSSIIPSFRWFLIAISIGFFWPLYRLIEKELSSLRDLFFSFVIYEALFYSFFSITGLRQTIATTATIIGISCIRQRKLFPFLVVILIASFIHKSVLVFLPFYFIANIKFSKKILLSSLIVMPLLFPYARIIAGFLITISGSDNYMSYLDSDSSTSGAQNFAVFMVLTAALVLISKKNTQNEVPNFVVNAMSLAILFIPLTWVDPSLMRIVQYFSLFLIIALPVAINNISKNSTLKYALYIGLISSLIFVIIRRSSEYAFFWDEMMLGNNYL